MDHGGPSRTAGSAAGHRAAHPVLDDGRIFRDPLALTILGDATRRDPTRRDAAQVAVDHARQVVVLGAGLDTFGYRNPFADNGVRVVEVDHPATQEWKRLTLERTEIDVPDTVAYLPVDRRRPRAGASVAFDYPNPVDQLSDRAQAAHATRAERVRSMGEPWLSSFDTDDLVTHLAGRGLDVVEDVGPDDIRRRWFGRPPEDPPRRAATSWWPAPRLAPVVRQLQIWSTVLLGVAIAQAGFGSGFGASLIARDKSDALGLVHRWNAWLVILVAAVGLVVAALYRRQGGPRWPVVFAACLLGGALVQAMLGSLRVVGLHLFVGVLFLCAVTTFCSYAWRHQREPALAQGSDGDSLGS